MTTTIAATVADLLVRRATDDGVGLLVGDRRWTWADVVAESRRYAAWMLAHRVEGAPFHVGILLDNTPEHLFALFGAALAGATTVALNSTRSGDELAVDIGHTDCLCVLTGAAHGERLAGRDLGGASVHRVDDAAWASALPAEPGALDGVVVDESDTFVLIFTSGSTGAPKAVIMSHRRATGMANESTWFGPDEVLYCAMPLFHANALNAIVFPALASGAAIALRDRFSASEFVPDLRRYGATFFTSVGRVLGYILATPPRDDDRDHLVKYALAPEASRSDIVAFRDRFGIHCITGYGSSENAVIMVPARGLGREPLGRPKDGIEAAVVDRETGEMCPDAVFDADGRLTNAAACTGEIVGLNVASRFEGYYENPEANEARCRNGWYWTGDLGYRDAEGVYYFAGRLEDWLRVDSENFATAPVERILSRQPEVAAVAVYAVPDERTADDQVMAAIEPVAGVVFDPDAFAAFLDAQPDLGAKWAPRYVRVTTIPVGPTNKMDRRSLRRQRWYTDDPIYWRPGRERRYVPFTAVDLAELEARFAAHGRELDRP